MGHRTPQYTSDLSDAQWEIIQVFLPLEYSGVGRPTEIDLREAVNAMLYVAKTGCQWENLPREFPKHQSVYSHFNKWCKNGLWEVINRALCYLVRHQEGHCPTQVPGVWIVKAPKPAKVGRTGLRCRQKSQMTQTSHSGGYPRLVAGGSRPHCPTSGAGWRKATPCQIIPDVALAPHHYLGAWGLSWAID